MIPRYNHNITIMSDCNPIYTPKRSQVIKNKIRRRRNKK